MSKPSTNTAGITRRNLPAAGDPVVALEDLLAWPGVAGPRTDEWVGMMTSLDRHGAGGRKATPSSRPFEIVVPSARASKGLLGAVARINARSRALAGRPLITLQIAG